MRRVLGALIGSALALLVVGVASASAATVVVDPSAMNGWGCINDTTNTTEPCTFVNGPGSPPFGIGSIQLTAATVNDRHIVATPNYTGTPLSSISNLDYWTYTASATPTLAISLQFDVKFDTGDTHYDGRLVFEPVNNPAQGPIVPGSWQHWIAAGTSGPGASGMWWASNQTRSGGLCPISSPCTWSQVLSNWPHAQISAVVASGNLLLKAGGGWVGFSGNADGLTVGTTSGSTTYDFELTVPLSPGTTVCNGVYDGSGKDVIVPSGATCTLLPGTQVSHDVKVQQGGTLIDQGASVGHDVSADQPKGIGIGGSGPGPAGSGFVGHDIKIDGVSDGGPGVVGDNYVCNTQVGHDVVVQNSAAGAGQWFIGDSDPECTGGGLDVGHDLVVRNNDNLVDVSENGTNTGGLPGNVGHDLRVTGNVFGYVVEGNVVGHDATCGPQPNSQDSDPAANQVGHKNNGC